MEGVPQVTFAKQSLLQGVDLIQFLADTGVFTSKGEAKKMLQSGGISINKEKVEDATLLLKEQHLLNNKYTLIQKGKKQYYLAVFE